MSLRSIAQFLALTLVTGCLPYTVGSTAQTVSPGESRRAAIGYVIADAIDLSGDSVAASMPGTARISSRCSIAARVSVITMTAVPALESATCCSPAKKP